MAEFHIPLKEPLEDKETGRVNPKWKRFFEQLNALLAGISFSNISGMLSLAQLVGHKATHQSAGSDAIKLDDLATPDDNTDLDASTLRHGLLPKLSGNAGDVLHGDGTWGPP
jgi:hypothetical protein